MMKLSTTICALLLALGLIPLAALAQSAPNTQAGVATAPGKVGGAATTEITAKVVAVDPARQMVTLRGPAGNEVDVQAQDPSQLTNIKKGDHVQVTYVEALAIAVAEAPAKR
jgi:hypothetical protein